MLALKLLVSLFLVLLLHGLFRWIVAKGLGVEIEKKRLFLTHQLSPAFDALPASKRITYILSGILFPFLLAFISMGMYLKGNGSGRNLAASNTDGIQCFETAKAIGLENGDMILRVGSEPFKYFEPGVVRNALLFDGVTEILVNRGGEEVLITVPEDFPVNQLTSKEPLFYARVPFVIGGFANNSPAEAAGLATRDSLVALNGEPMIYLDEYVEVISNSASQELAITYIRDNEEAVVNVLVNEQGKIGAAPFMPRFETEKLGFVGAMAQAVPKSWTYFAEIFPKFQAGQSESLGGFTSIGKLLPGWDWSMVYLMIVRLAYLLGFINIIPLKGLDGGLLR